MPVPFLPVENPFPLLPSNNRQKRGLLNILGETSKFLFGTATEEDIKRVGKSIEDGLNEVKGTLKITTTNIENQITSIINDTQRIANMIKNTDTAIQALTNHVMLAEIYNNIEITLNSIHFTILQMHQIDFDIRTGLTPLIIKNMDFSDIKTRIAQEYSEEMILLNEFQIKISDNKFMYILNIPLIKNEKYKAEQIVPFPTIYKNTSILLNEKAQKFFLTKGSFVIDNDDNDCYKKNRTVCNIHNSINNMETYPHSCYSELLSKDTSEQCNYVTTSLETHMINLCKKWIIFSAKPTTTTLVCKKEISIEILENVTIIPQHCSVHQEKFSLNGIKEKIDNVIQFQIEPIFVNNFTRNWEVPEENIILHNDEIKSSIRDTLKVVENTKFHTNIQYISIGSIGLVIVIVIIILVIICICKRNKKEVNSMVLKEIVSPIIENINPLIEKEAVKQQQIRCYPTLQTVH
jgi:3-dehydroquinate dehydratase